jgi:preprotein translocase subunit YajC
MSFFISDAMAEGAAEAAGPGLAGLIPFVILFAVFYFFLIRPQSKRVKDHKKMTEAMAKDDEVVTNGGIIGKITTISAEDDFISLEIADGVVIRLQKQYVAGQLPKGTIKSV